MYSSFNLSKKIILLIIGVMLFVPSASGYMTPKSKIELYLEHDLIIFGKVLSTEDVHDSNQTPRTKYQIMVLQNIKGKTISKDITVIGLGSLNSTRQIEDQTIFTKEHQVLLFLTRDSDGNWFASPYSVTSDSLNPDKQFVLPPLQLYKAGISLEDINCKTGLELATKSSNGNPVCLKSKDKLLERGWIK